MAEENATMLQELSGYQLPYEDCQKLLKIFNGNLEQAAEKFFSSDLSTVHKLIDGSKPTWDESAFGASRYADELNNSVPTFNIDYPPGFDNHSRSGANSTAPTRPNSRIGTRPASALSTHAGDDLMQSIESAQESGVTGNNSKPVFGPATRNDYDSASWAMVPATTASEYIADPIPKYRQREEGQPAILKPSPRFNYFPAMLTILHSIPQFRNALLSPAVSHDDYWVGDEWWRGNPSGRARIMDTTVGWDEAYGLDIIHETQRLMAFLDNTDRAYATIESMLDMDAWKQLEAPSLQDPDDDMLKFLILWSAAYAKQDPEFRLDGVLRSVVNAQQRVDSFVLDSTVSKRDGRETDIYDVLDDTFFPSPDGTAHIMDISNVLIFRLEGANQDSNELGCRIPATLYADRYLEKNRHVIQSMFDEMAVHNTQLDTIKDQTDRLRYHTPAKRNSKRIDSLKLLKTSIKAFQPKEESDELDPKDAATLSHLQTLYDSIETKLAALEEQHKQALEALNLISSRFKPTIDDGAAPLIDLTMPSYPAGQSPEDAMHHPYSLCGVATRRDVIYLLHPDTTSNTPGAKQWWRVQYDNESGTANIIRDRVDTQQVLERATSEAASVLLVYANEAATSTPLLDLPKPLADFVKKDKLAFLEELQRSHELGAAGSGWDDFGDEPRGDWDTTTTQQSQPHTDHSSSATATANPPAYNHDWTNLSAQQYRAHPSDARTDEAVSSATLTPNTEGDDAGVTEMLGPDRGGSRGDAMDVDGFGYGYGSEGVDTEQSDVQQRDVKEGDVKPSDVNASDVDVKEQDVKERGVKHIETKTKSGDSQTINVMELDSDDDGETQHIEFSNDSRGEGGSKGKGG